MKSADEIRKLTDLSTPIMPEYWQATVMWTKQWNKIKSALLAYAAMVERCEERIKKYSKEMEDLGQSCVEMQRERVRNRIMCTEFNYILRGNAGKEVKDA